MRRTWILVVDDERSEEEVVVFGEDMNELELERSGRFLTCCDAPGRSGGREWRHAQADLVADMNDYVGEYSSAAKAPNSWLTVKDGALVAHHRRHGDIELTLLAPDEFRGNQWFIPALVFDRDAGGQVIGFRRRRSRCRRSLRRCRTRSRR